MPTTGSLQKKIREKKETARKTSRPRYGQIKAGWKNVRTRVKGRSPYYGPGLIGITPGGDRKWNWEGTLLVLNETTKKQRGWVPQAGSLPGFLEQKVSRVPGGGGSDAKMPRPVARPRHEFHPDAQVGLRGPEEQPPKPRSREKTNKKKKKSVNSRSLKCACRGEPP